MKLQLLFNGNDERLTRKEDCHDHICDEKCTREIMGLGYNPAGDSDHNFKQLRSWDPGDSDGN